MSLGHRGGDSGWAAFRAGGIVGLGRLPASNDARAWTRRRTIATRGASAALLIAATADPCENARERKSVGPKDQMRGFAKDESSGLPVHESLFIGDDDFFERPAPRPCVECVEGRVPLLGEAIRCWAHRSGTMSSLRTSWRVGPARRAGSQPFSIASSSPILTLRPPTPPVCTPPTSEAFSSPSTSSSAFATLAA